MPSKDFFCHRCLKLDKSVQNKLHKCMKKKLIVGNCYLKNLKVLTHLTRWPWPLIQSRQIKSVPLLPGMYVWTKFEEGRSRRSWVIERKWFKHIWPWWPWPLTQWSQNHYGSSAAQDGCMDKVWGRKVKAFSSYWSETKRLQTDRQTCAKQYVLSSSKGGHKKTIYGIVLP